MGFWSGLDKGHGIMRTRLAASILRFPRAHDIRRYRVLCKYRGTFEYAEPTQAE